MSANWDPAIGNIIAEAMDKVGKDGTITVEEAKSIETTLEVVEGMQFDKGYLSPYFATNAETLEAIVEDAYILLYEKKVSAMKDLLPLLADCAGIALSATVGQYFWVQAFKAGEMSAVAPFEYLRLPFAVFVGWLIWGETPVIWTYVGAAIVIALYLLVGGRAYCSWVCPMNLVTDAAAWLRAKPQLRGAKKNQILSFINGPPKSNSGSTE